MKKIVLTSVFIWIHFILSAQSEYKKYVSYPIAGNDYSIGSIESADGIRWIISKGGNHSMLTKISSDGVIMSSDILNSGYNIDFPRAIFQGPHNRMIIVGNLYFTGHYIPYFLKLDSAGSIVAAKYYYNASDITLGACIMDSDGNIVLSGSNVPDKGSTLIKLDTAGTVIWSKKYSFGERESPLGLINVNNGYIFCSNTLDMGLYYTNNRVIKLTLNGDTVWSKKIAIDSVNVITNLINGANGEIIVGGMTDYNSDRRTFLARFDSSFNFIVGWKFHAGIIQYLNTSSDGNIVATGSINASTSSSNVFSMKFDYYLNRLWTNNYPSTYISKAYHIRENSDNTISICGFIGTGTNDQSVLLMQTDALGELNSLDCPSNAVSWGRSTLVCNSVSGVDTVTNSIPFVSNNLNFTITAANPVNDFCTTGIESKFEKDLSVFPNPCEQELRIKYSGIIKSFQIVDLAGRLVIADQWNSDVINLQNIRSGFYILKLQTEHGVLCKEFVRK